MRNENASVSRNGRRRRVRTLIVVVIIVIVGGTAGGIAIARRSNAPSHPKVLNEPTKAREVRPFSPKKDARFDPLPLERERHER